MTLNNLQKVSPLARYAEIESCYLGPEISPEQFIPEHFFLFLVKGRMEGYDGHQYYQMEAGEACLAVKDHLIRYTKSKENDQFEKVAVIFDEAFLKAFHKKHEMKVSQRPFGPPFVGIEVSELVLNFIYSLKPFYKGEGRIEAAFADVKREELLLILLKEQPGLADLLFDFSRPGKIDLKAFMHKNYKFNVGVERFAYLTGRSLSAFKRDFVEIFGATPHRWLMTKRLEEAHFLLDKRKKKASEIYLELGFEDLTHFSHAFKRRFGVAPKHLVA